MDTFDDVPDDTFYSDETGRVKRGRARRRPDDLNGQFAVVPVAGTHRDRTKKVYGKQSPGSRGRGNGAASANRLRKRERQKILLEARIAGHSWREAARMAGYAGSGPAYVAASEAIADIPREAADEARALEMSRLDEVIRGCLRFAAAGDAHAAMAVIKASERRARLLGLDLTEPAAATIDVRLQAMLIELVGLPPEEFELIESDMSRLIDASQRSTDRASRTAGATASGD